MAYAQAWRQAYSGAQYPVKAGVVDAFTQSLICQEITPNEHPDDFPMIPFLFLCTMPKRQAVVIFPEVNYKLSLVMENVKGESWRRSTSSSKIGILVLIMHTAWSPNTSS
jgi:hypothetical protein